MNHLSRNAHAKSGAVSCLLAGGFSECIEKYFETIADLADRGLGVWCLEWFGQGESTRPRRRPNRPEARDYQQDAADLARFTLDIAGGGKPLVGRKHGRSPRMGAARPAH